MRIGIVTTWFERGAAYVSRQYAELLSSQHDIYIYARAGEEQEKENTVWNQYDICWDKERSISRYIGAYLNLRQMKAWIRSKNLHIVLFNEQQWWPAVIAARECDVVIGAYVDYYTKATVPFFGSYDFLLCNTRRHHSVFSKHEKAIYIPWGTNCDLFKPQQKERRKDDRVVFFHSAGMNPERKGTEIAIKALDLLYQQRQPCKMLIHTQRDIGIFFPDLKVVISKLIQAEVLEIITGTVAAPGLYHRGDVYVYPTRLEGIGLTIAEAYACGLPVIVPDEPPMNEFISPEQAERSLVPVSSRRPRDDGYYWPLCIVDESDLSEKMRMYIENSGNLGELQNAARSHAVAHLNWENNSAALNDAMKHLHRTVIDAKVTAAIRKHERRIHPLLRYGSILFRVYFGMRKLGGKIRGKVRSAR
ncbi:MAG: glycosyltransferase family 4 protein [Spirochaetales bacterium]|nr:glycosyltransferase family 4 protein [Spirochaetales bacterium]